MLPELAAQVSRKSFLDPGISGMAGIPWNHERVDLAAWDREAFDHSLIGMAIKGQGDQEVRRWLTGRVHFMPQV